MKKNKIERLFEVMERIDNTFKRVKGGDLTSEEMTEVILENPKRIDDFDLEKLESSNILDILMYEPQLLDKLRPFLGNLRGEDILHLIIYQPKVRNDLENFKYLIRDYSIYDELKNYPQHIQHIEDVLDKLDADQIDALIKRHPQLKQNMGMRKIIIDKGLSREFL